MIPSLVIGNCKMNGNYVANYTLLTERLPDIATNRRARVSVCPPFPYLAQVCQRLVGSRVCLGAQNVSAHSGGEGS
ncbi:triose-phosphate isomerase [Marinobacter salicampi]|uniref:triose-phosphate isomerase n=1 Tax=Marinobacter salicampi TaxID=435907 RepID=UPI00140A3A16|nr:triose-phosphate isomerase [Marinobacter salicampi]